ncbi:hypothetical protein GQR58_026020 [Nymphon striatum]|nr:hypothetical protein GQR58_026020 [Nymphon striatum]
MNTRTFSEIVITLVLLTVASALAAAESSSANIGKKEYQNNCAVCHGVSGKGDGSFVELLKQVPSDLTLISKRNGGTYPLIKVYDLIAGVGKIPSHGTQEMPIWGERYNQEIVQDLGPMNTGPSPSVRERILELVFYIGSNIPTRFKGSAEDIVMDCSGLSFLCDLRSTLIASGPRPSRRLRRISNKGFSVEKVPKSGGVIFSLFLVDSRLGISRFDSGITAKNSCNRSAATHKISVLLSECFTLILCAR